MRLRGGALELARPRGVALRVHWTLPLGLFVLGGFEIAPVRWAALVALIVLHELGHAAVALRVRCAVQSVEVHGFGGLCRWAGAPTPIARAAIAWGGVAAQAVLLGVTLLVEAIVGSPSTGAGRELVTTFVTLNLIIAALNLLPFGPLDGKEAWPLVPLWLARLRKRRARRAQKAKLAIVPSDDDLRRKLAELDRLETSRKPPDLDEVRRSVLRVVEKKKS